MNKNIIDKDSEWDLNALLSSDDDTQLPTIRQKIDTEVQRFVKKWEQNNDYLTNPETLKTALDEYEALMRNFGTSGPESLYFSLRRSQDQVSSVIKARYNIALEGSTKRSNTLLFFTHRLSKVSKEVQTVFLSI